MGSPHTITPNVRALLAEQDVTCPPVSHPADPEHDITILRNIPREFAIHDEHSANWLCRQIRQARDYADHVKVWTDRELARAAREEQVLMHLFGRQIEDWTRGELARLRGKRKSINLPAASVGFRTTLTRLVIDDEASVIDWARQNLPQAIAIITKVMKSVIDDHFRNTGEVPADGVRVEASVEKFFVR